MGGHFCQKTFQKINSDFDVDPGVDGDKGDVDEDVPSNPIYFLYEDVDGDDAVENPDVDVDGGRVQ